MKKLLALIALSVMWANCSARTHSRTVSITNNTDTTIEVSDSENHETSIDSGRSGSLAITVREQHGSFPVPSLLLPYTTTITVRDSEGSNSIEIDENTNRVTVDPGLELNKD